MDTVESLNKLDEEEKKSFAEILKKEIIRALWIIILIEVFFLFFRILFRLFGANPNSPVVAFFYIISDLILLPFVSMFPQFTLTGRAAVDMTAFMGLIVYLVADFLLMGITFIVANMFKLSTNLPEIEEHNNHASSHGNKQTSLQKQGEKKVFDEHERRPL